MSEPDRTKFDIWYESIAGQMFNFKKQLAMYCFVAGGLYKIQKGVYRIYKDGSIRMCNACGMCYEGF